jgi:predicted nucleotidyltransferase
MDWCIKKEVSKSQLLDIANNYALAVLSYFPSIIDILLFGSVNKGKYHTWSDLDIAIVGNWENELDVLSKLYDIAFSKGYFRVHPVCVTTESFYNEHLDGFIEEIKNGLSLIAALNTQEAKL